MATDFRPFAAFRRADAGDQGDNPDSGVHRGVDHSILSPAAPVQSPKHTVSLNGGLESSYLLAYGEVVSNVSEGRAYVRIDLDQAKRIHLERRLLEIREDEIWKAAKAGGGK